MNIKLPIFKSFTIRQKFFICNFICKQCLDSGNSMDLEKAPRKSLDI